VGVLMRNVCAWLVLVVGGCGDNMNGGVMDAPKQPDSPPQPDAPDVADYSWDEGGEVRIEYQEILTSTGTNYRARATSFFWKSKDLPRYPFFDIPGCTKMDMDDHFPLAMGTTHEYLDVGDVTVSGGTMPLTIPLGPNPGVDGLFRPHDGTWHFFVGNNMGSTYFGNWDANYSVAFGGTADWPAQNYTDSIYMAPQWTLGTPGFEAIQLAADTPVTVTYTPGVAANKPPGATINMVAALIVPPMGPVVDCINDQLTGTITIPAEMVNHARALGSSGLMARAHVVHEVKELTDGVTHNRKRIDFISIWCYVTPWTAI
jgi:hypothetical protein